MSIFQRTIRFFILITATVLGFLMAAATVLARQFVTPSRQGLWSKPDDVGMTFEDINFAARDGLRVSGWFVPAAQPAEAATLVMLHGLGWNRLGNSADSFFDNITGATQIELLHLAKSLHQSGYNLLMIDMRNHGKSAEAEPVTFGLQESNDVLGALDYLQSRDDVNAERIGLLGFSIGANAALFTLGHTDLVKAVAAVQPIQPQQFGQRLAVDMLGSFGSPVFSVAQAIYQKAGGISMHTINPCDAATAAGDAPILYIQGDRDNWGSPRQVESMAKATPNAQSIFVEAGNRYQGYQHVIDHPELVSDFFWKNL